MAAPPGVEISAVAANEANRWRTTQAFLEETLALIAPLESLPGFEALFLISIDDQEQSTITGNTEVVIPALLDAVTTPLRLDAIRYASVSCSRFDVLLHKMDRDPNLVCVLALNRQHGNFALAKLKLEMICAS